MNTPRPDPLSSAERELAALLSRQGPHGEPSAALDARILAASHEATARTRAGARKPRWPVVFGVAASMVFAVGIAWQLRPSPPRVQTSEVASSEIHAAHPQRPVPVQDAMPMPAPEAARAAGPVAPPSAASASRAEASAGPESRVASAQPTTPAPASPSATSPPRQRAADRASLSAPNAQARATTPPRSIAPPPPPPAPPAASTGSARRPIDSDRRQASIADLDAIGQAEVGTSAKAAAPGARAAASTAAATRRLESPAMSVPRRQPERRAALDRIEVSGSRTRTDLQVPVAQDAQLQVHDWLERVRTRYGLGDEAAARQSLLLFVKENPDETVPDDLEPLLDQ